MRIAVISLLIGPLWPATGLGGEIVSVLNGAAEIEVPAGYIRTTAATPGKMVEQFALRADAERRAGIATHFNVGPPSFPWDWEQLQTWAQENAAARKARRFDAGLYGVAEDKETGYRHASGVLGAFAYIICDESHDPVICAWGMDYEALIEFEENPPPDDRLANASPEEIVAILREPGNADLLEGVLASFHWIKR